MQERQSGSQAPILYGISILVVFLCLAALYESWSIPFSVIMVVPLGVIGALLAATLRGLENDVFFQVGLLTTVGLSAKNAILIVEFARELQQGQGMGPIEAAMEAARLRLRPILMTSLAFILGVMPLAISNGAGSASQHAIGTGVIGGMLTATFLAIFMIPMFFVVIRAKFGGEKEDPDEALAHYDQHHPHDRKVAVRLAGRRMKARARTDIEMQKHSLIAVAVALFAAGCTMAPKYERPAAPVTATFPTGGVYDTQPDPASATAGKRPHARSARPARGYRLARFLRRSAHAAASIEIALKNNRDLRVSVLNVQASRRSTGSCAPACFPTLDAAASQSKSRTPKDLSFFDQTISNSYSVGLNASWEIDFFGRIQQPEGSGAGAVPGDGRKRARRRKSRWCRRWRTST